MLKSLSSRHDASEIDGITSGFPQSPTRASLSVVYARGYKHRSSSFFPSRHHHRCRLIESLLPRTSSCFVVRTSNLYTPSTCALEPWTSPRSQALPLLRESTAQSDKLHHKNKKHTKVERRGFQNQEQRYRRGAFSLIRFRSALFTCVHLATV